MLILPYVCSLFSKVAKNSSQHPEMLPPKENRAGVYRYTALGIWLFVTALMILDRFYWNVWPRQDICSPGCGTDFFCDVNEVGLKMGSASDRYATGRRFTAAGHAVPTNGCRQSEISTWEIVAEAPP